MSKRAPNEKLEHEYRLMDLIDTYALEHDMSKRQVLLSCLSICVNVARDMNAPLSDLIDATIHMWDIDRRVEESTKEKN